MHQYRITAARPPTDMDLVVALSDTPVVKETYAWFTGRIRSLTILELRLAALLPDAELVTRTERLVAWASRTHSVTLVYWLCDRELEVTIDRDLEEAVAVIIGDVARAPGSAQAAGGQREQLDGRSERSRYGEPMSEPVITRVVAIEDLPPGSRATRRLIAAWSDGTQSEALAWFSDEWLVSEGDHGNLGLMSSRG